MSTPPFLELPERTLAYELSTPRGGLAVHETLPTGERRGTAVLVPGFTGSKEDFIAVLSPLADTGYRVLAVDQKGQFESPGPDDPAAYRVDELATDLRAVVGCLGDGPVHLVGHSFGGLVCRAAVIADDTVARSLTLMSSGPAAVDGVFAQRLSLLEPVLTEYGLEGLWHAVNALDHADGKIEEPPAQIAEFLHRRFMSNAPAGLAGMALALREERDRVDDLGATGLPVLVTYGEQDDIWSPSTQAKMARRLGARDHPIRHAEHSPAAEQPAATAAVLAGFWTDADRSRRPEQPADA